MAQDEPLATRRLGQDRAGSLRVRPVIPEPRRAQEFLRAYCAVAEARSMLTPGPIEDEIETFFR